MTDHAQEITGENPRLVREDAVVAVSEQSEPTLYHEEKGEPVYSIFSPGEKWVIVALTSIASLFSPLTANIYFPAIPVIAAAFNQSIENINVSVTVYMVLQGVSPVFWGSLADSRICGRRPIYLACLLLLCLSNVGLALTPTNAYWLLLFLRCVQAAGSAITVALGAGTIMDIATPGERGLFLAVSSFGPMLGPCIGPVAGGLLAGNLGWRSIFWFLCIASGLCLVLQTILLPETLRTIVGDGSVPAPVFDRPLLPIIGSSRKGETPSLPEPDKGSHNPWTVMMMFRNIDLCMILFSTAIPYAVFYCILTTTSQIFLVVNPSLTEIDLGLCYIAIGAGALFGGVIAGKLLDWDFKRYQRQATAAGDVEKKSKLKMPIEYIRLRNSPYYWALFVVLVVSYGWMAEARVAIAGLLIIQFFAATLALCVFNSNQMLMMDLFPGMGASVTATNNLVRCVFGAVFVSIIDYILVVGTGWAFTILGAICIVSYPVALVEWRWGSVWRLKREERARRGSDDTTDYTGPTLDVRHGIHL